MHLFPLLGFVLSIFALLAGCDHPNVPSIALRRGLSGEPSSLDPAAATDTFSVQVIQDLYEGLTVEASSGAAVPGVASSWSTDASGLEYKFQLRPDARWSNGQPVRAQDFVTAWRRVLDPKQGSPLADNMRIIAGAEAIIEGRAEVETLGAEAVNDHVLRVKLEHPAAYFPQILATSAALPVYSDAAARSHEPAHLLSNGPYVLSEWRPGSDLKVIANGKYWDKANVHIPSVEYQFSSDDNSQYARYRSGQLDMTDSVPASALPSLRAQHASELVIAPYLGTVYYGVNFSNKALASNVALRQSLAMAIDRKKLVESLGFGQIGAFGFIPPGTWNYEPQSWPWANLKSEDQVAEAKRLYASAGFSAASPLKIRLLSNSNPVIKRTSIVIASMWKETLGVDTLLSEEEYRVFLESRHDKSRWDVVRLAWTADFNDASDFLEIFRTRSSNNDFGYANTAFDQLMEQASTTADAGKRRELLENAERTMLADYPIFPLYFFVSKRLVKPSIVGVKPSPLDHVRSKALQIRTP